MRDAKERYKNKQPPGFDDSKKEGFYYKGRLRERKYGDLLVWRETLKYLQSREEIEFVVFVTNDGTSHKKSDIRHRHHDKNYDIHISLISELYYENTKKLYLMTNQEFIEHLVEMTEEDKNRIEEIATTINIEQIQELGNQLAVSLNSDRIQGLGNQLSDNLNLNHIQGIGNQLADNLNLDSIQGVGNQLAGNLNLDSIQGVGNHLAGNINLDRIPNLNNQLTESINLSSMQGLNNQLNNYILKETSKDANNENRKE